MERSVEELFESLDNHIIFDFYQKHHFNNQL